MDNEFQSRVEHFAALKPKYQATKYDDSSPSSLLYLILRKLDLGIELTEFEFNWLLEHELFETFETIEQEKRSREEELIKLKIEFEHLLSKYKALQYSISKLVEPLYPILWKLDSENHLNDSEVEHLKYSGLNETIAIAQELEQKREFAALKINYQATQHEDSYPSSHLYTVLKRLESEIYLSEQDINLLRKRKLAKTIAIACLPHA